MILEGCRMTKKSNRCTLVDSDHVDSDHIDSDDIRKNRGKVIDVDVGGGGDDAAASDDDDDDDNDDDDDEEEEEQEEEAEEAGRREEGKKGRREEGKKGRGAQQGGSQPWFHSFMIIVLVAEMAVQSSRQRDDDCWPSSKQSIQLKMI